MIHCSIIQNLVGLWGFVILLPVFEHTPPPIRAHFCKCWCTNVDRIMKKKLKLVFWQCVKAVIEGFQLWTVNCKLGDKEYWMLDFCHSPIDTCAYGTCRSTLECAWAHVQKWVWILTGEWQTLDYCPYRLCYSYFQHWRNVSFAVHQ